MTFPRILTPQIFPYTVSFWGQVSCFTFAAVFVYWRGTGVRGQCINAVMIQVDKIFA